MNFLELVKDLHRECGSGGSAPSAVTDQRGESLRLVNWIKRANRLIEVKWHNWKFLWGGTHSFNTAAAQDAYSELPDGFARWDRTSGFVDGEPLTFEEYEPKKHNLLAAASGRPDTAIILPTGGLRLYPTPDAVYPVLIDWYKVPVELTENASQSSIPAQYHDAIIGRAMILYGNYENAPEVKTAGSELLGDVLPRLESDQLPGQSDQYDLSAESFVMVVE